MYSPSKSTLSLSLFMTGIATALPPAAMAQVEPGTKTLVEQTMLSTDLAVLSATLILLVMATTLAISWSPKSLSKSTKDGGFNAFLRRTGFNHETSNKEDPSESVYMANTNLHIKPRKATKTFEFERTRQ